MSRITIELDEELKKKIKIYCAMKNITLKQFLTEIINKIINE